MVSGKILELQLVVFFVQISYTIFDYNSLFKFKFILVLMIFLIKALMSDVRGGVMGIIEHLSGH